VQDAKQEDAYVRARALVSRVYQLPEGERDPFIQQACEGDEGLRSEVAWLLDVLRGPDDGFLEQAPGATVRETGDLHVARPHDYTLIRQIGEGGMGVVYLAERVEGDFRQTVALKLLGTPALASHAAVSRFLFERQLLARLNHPNIAHLVDAGARGDGRPFLAMEYVQGIRIDEYCIANASPLAERLRLSIKICAALQYAHEQLVIHRDIKPANILVTPEGEPKLLDFGIARQLASPASEITSTVAGQRIMTLAYASPEQIEGKPLSTATDVYSMGVVLYELLTGSHPWGETENPAEIVRMVSRSDPDPPSVAQRRQAGPGTGARRAWWRPWRRAGLSRDLDAIVLKALARRPADRDSSPRALADDLQRYLDNRPVEARRGHFGYRLNKFVHRNRFVLSAAATVLALIVAFAVNRQLQLERTLAEQAKTAQVRDFMIALFESSRLEQTQGSDVSAREILDRGMARIRAALGGDPATRGALLQAVAAAYHSLGVRDEAGAAAEEALALARRDPATSPDTVAGLLLLLADVNGNNQNATAQESYAREALAIAQSEPGVDRAFAAAAQRHIANALTKQARPRSEVEPYFLGAVEASRRIDPEGEEYLNALQDYGVALRQWDSPREALAQLRPAFDMATAKYGDGDPRTVQLAAEYGLALERSGDPLGAEQVLRRAYDQQIRLYGPDNPATAYVRGYLAFSLMSQRRFADAEPLLRETMEMGRKHDAVGNSTFNDTMNLGFALRELKRFEDAEALYREALSMVSAAFPPDRQAVMRATVHTYLGMTLQGQGRNAQAEAMLHQALADLPDVDETRRTRASAWRGLAAAAMAQGDGKAAEAAARNALALYDPDTWWHADTAVDVAEALIAQRRHGDAEPLLRAALERFDADFPAGDPRTRRAAQALAGVYRAQDRHDRAAEVRTRYALDRTP
jgi:eukaryotic-like serine/threonine-protein kinase